MRPFFSEYKEIIKNRIVVVLFFEIMYLFINYIFYLQNSKYYTSPIMALVILIVILLPFRFASKKKTRFTKNEKLTACILVHFIIKIRNISIDEKEKIGEILSKIFADRNPKVVLEFLYQYDFSSLEDATAKMARKDIFYKNRLLKYLFRIALSGNFVSLLNEKEILEIAEKIKIGKAPFNKRKFFCEKAGYRFESTQSKVITHEYDFEAQLITKAYQTLELTPDSSVEEIKKAKRRLVKQFHPDKTRVNDKEDNLQFIEITEAYNIIKRHRNIK
jgi:DnaJ-domain-containing protein 1